MNIGAIKESRAGETRVSRTPATVAQLVGLGYEVVLDPTAGAAASFPDLAYVEAGATVGAAVTADVVFGVNARSSEQLGRMKPGAILVSLLSPALSPELVEDLARRPLTALAMDAVPRISRAPVAGRVVLDGEHCGISGGGGGSACVRAVLHRSGDRGGQGASGEGSHASAQGKKKKSLALFIDEVLSAFK